MNNKTHKAIIGTYITHMPNSGGTGSTMTTKYINMPTKHFWQPTVYTQTTKHHNDMN